MAHFRSFWFGGELSPYEQLAMTSFIEHGHAYTLFTYEEITVPDQVALRDAAEILPRSRLFFYKSGFGKGSVAGFANLFRYHMLHALGGWWVDTDVVCLSSDLEDGEIFLGWERDGLLGNAILKFPPQHPFVAALRDAAETAGTDIAWGDTGPYLVTRLASTNGVLSHAVAARSAYPVHWSEALAMLDPAEAARCREKIGSAGLLHLWNEVLRGAGVDKHAPPPRGSFLAELFERYGSAAFSSGRPGQRSSRAAQSDVRVS